ncbi:MAG TPA: serine/threonine-protein kinase [Candidatus Xenobia bacterium]
MLPKPKKRPPLKAPGTILHERFVIESLLGQGGMGAVYQARHKLLNQVVAVKELWGDEPDPKQWSKAVAQFQSEARILSMLNHPSLVKILDYFSDGDSHYLVLELVEGHSLDRYVPKPPRFLEESIVLGWMLQICDVLEYLHRHKPPIIYRDLKPSNIMLDANGKIRLIDFGIARTAVDEETTGTYLKGAGSLGFSPPEQYLSTCDARSDVYSLGATIYALLCGEPPPIAVVRTVADTLRPLRQLNPEVTVRVERAVLRMLSARAEDRPADIAQVRRWLTTDDPMTAAPTARVKVLPAHPTFFHTWPGILAGTVAVAGLTAGLGFLVRGRTPAAPTPTATPAAVSTASPTPSPGASTTMPSAPVTKERGAPATARPRP